jgi:hypothetical protein
MASIGKPIIWRESFMREFHGINNGLAPVQLSE